MAYKVNFTFTFIPTSCFYRPQRGNSVLESKVNDVPYRILAVTLDVTQFGTEQVMQLRLVLASHSEHRPATLAILRVLQILTPVV